MIKGIFDYVELDENQEFENPLVNVCFEFIRPQIDSDIEKYEQKCETNKRNALKRYGKNKDTNSDDNESDANATERMHNKAQPVIKDNNNKIKEKETKDNSNEIKEILSSCHYPSSKILKLSDDATTVIDRIIEKYPYDYKFYIEKAVNYYLQQFDDNNYKFILGSNRFITDELERNIEESKNVASKADGWQTAQVEWQ